mmetsp:Transcript_48719/g.136300  ORF Transcript_48719/g.136300 Transcript_48719/m.136300 type:complete len:303 (+) Transcript_48719:749-1657(+)
MRTLSPMRSTIFALSSRCISIIFRFKDFIRWSGRFCTDVAVMPLATDSLRSTHHKGRPLWAMAPSENTTWPSVTALASSMKPSGTPVEATSSESSANWASSLLTALCLTSSSSCMARKFFSFCSISARESLRSSLSLANASSVMEPPPLAVSMRLARCKKQPRNVRRRADIAFLRATYFQSSTPSSSVKFSISRVWSAFARSVRPCETETSSRMFQTTESGSTSSRSNESPPTSRRASAMAHAAFIARTVWPGRGVSERLATMTRRSPSPWSANDRCNWRAWASVAAVVTHATLLPAWAFTI